MRILIACEYSGRMREAFRAKGHDVTSIDLLPSEDDSPHHIIGDAVACAYHHGKWDIIIAHPPCTYLTNSGVRWLYTGRTIETGRPDNPTIEKEIDRARWQGMKHAAAFFAQLYNAPVEVGLAIENPIMHQHGRDAISDCLGYDLPKPHYVQPWWFGDPAFKATGFTLKGLRPLKKPATALVPPKPGTDEHKRWSVIHNMAPSEDRWKERSRTFPGIAAAAAEAWG